MTEKTCLKQIPSQFCIKMVNVDCRRTRAICEARVFSIGSSPCHVELFVKPEFFLLVRLALHTDLHHRFTPPGQLHEECVSFSSIDKRLRETATWNTAGVTLSPVCPSLYWWRRLVRYNDNRHIPEGKTRFNLLVFSHPPAD